MRKPCRLKDSENVHTVRIWTRWKNIDSSKCKCLCPFCNKKVVAHKWSMAGTGKRCPKCKAILQKGYCYQWRDRLGKDSVIKIRTPGELKRIEQQGKKEYGKQSMLHCHTLTRKSSLELMMYYATFMMYWEYRRVITRPELYIELVTGSTIEPKLHRRYLEMMELKSDSTK